MTSLYLCRAACARLTSRHLLTGCCVVHTKPFLITAAPPGTTVTLLHKPCLTHSVRPPHFVAPQLCMESRKRLSTSAQDSEKKLEYVEEHPTWGKLMSSSRIGILARISRIIAISLPVFLAAPLPFVLMSTSLTAGFKLKFIIYQLIPLAIIIGHHLIFRSFAFKIYFSDETKKYTMLQYTFMLKEKVTEFTAQDVNTDPRELGFLVRNSPYTLGNCRIKGKVALIDRNVFFHAFEQRKSKSDM